MSGYIGITIGPVVDTLMLAKSPAAMWYASSMFSSLTEKICGGMAGEKILSPYYSGERFSDGIGRYHDRIIVKNADEAKIRSVIDESAAAIAKEVAKDLDLSEAESSETVEFMKNYLQIHYACLDDAADDGAAITELNDILNCLEQMPTPNSDNKNHPIIRLFNGTAESRNKYINDKLKSLGITSQLTNGRGTFRSIPEISRTANDCKYGYYYAVVEADGDRVGQYIETLGGGIKDFSKRCFDYAGEAAKLIGEFGGMTVYAGGDDLLFIAPVRSKDGKSVFELCRDISNCFNEYISGAPTVSFGISIRHEGFPLYEALGSSLNALYMAKSNSVGKNAMVIDLQKHSGQAIKIAVPFDRYDMFDKVFKLYLGQEDQMLKSAIYIFNERKTMFDYKPLTSGIIRNIIGNTFDNEDQKKSEGFVKKLSDTLVEFFGGDGKKINAYEKNEVCVPIKTFEALLRLSKFMIEKGAEEHE